MDRLDDSSSMDSTKVGVDETRPVTKETPPTGYGGTDIAVNPSLADLEEMAAKADEEVSVAELLELTKQGSREASRMIRERYGDVDTLCYKLGTNPTQGLSASDVDDKVRRRQKFGGNVIPVKESKSFFLFLWEALQDPTLIILTVAAIVSLGLTFYMPPPSGEVGEFVNRTMEIDVNNTTAAPLYSPETRSGWIEAIGILIAVIIVVLVTASVNWSKDAQFRGLQDKIVEQFTTTVVRSGQYLELPVDEIVVGDIVIVGYGDLIPADGILIHGADLNVDESSHTGESDDVNKSPQKNPLLYSGTHVMQGSGRMVVIAVGVNSAKGIIFSLLGVTYNDESDPDEKRSLLHRKLVKTALQITYAGTVIAVLTFLILTTRFCIETMVVHGRPWNNAYVHQFVRFFIISLTLLAVAVPEGLPLAVVLALAYSVKKMMADNNLVRHLDACETMGSATTICCDKTGTLTANRMTVVQSHIAGTLFTNGTKMEEQLPVDARRAMATCLSINTSYTSQVANIVNKLNKQKFSCTAIGSKTECALLDFVSRLGFPYEPIRIEYPETEFVHVYPFSSERKWMGTVIKPQPGLPVMLSEDGKKSDGVADCRLIVKGAAEIVLSRCDWIVGEGSLIRSLEVDGLRQRMGDIIINMARQGLRTLCIAYKDFYHDNNNAQIGEWEGRLTDDWDWSAESHVMSGLVCLGLVGIEDPVRPEVEQAVLKCQQAGIVVRMVTGDNVETARFVAVKCGIISAANEEGFLVLEGPEFNKRIRGQPDGPVEQTLMDEVWPKLRVLARSSPEDKHTLVKGIMDCRQAKDGEVVAVTGDGTNDGPALKKAHVGFAMGIAGTDVAKEASDIILIDDNFSSIVKAVVWGRHVYDSIAKFLQFQLTVNIVAAVIALVGAVVVMDSPLKGAQMLWVNLLMDTLASLSLATEKPTDEVLNRKPYGCSRPLISPSMLLNILAHSAYEIVVLLILLFLGERIMHVENGRSEVLRGFPSVHYTIIFNAFVMMILFNEINARKLDFSFNIFSGLHRSPLFVIIWFTSFASQIVIVQLGSDVFSTVALNFQQWIWCLLFGVGDLIYGMIVSSCVRLFRSIHQRSELHGSLMGNKNSFSYELLDPENKETSLITK